MDKYAVKFYDEEQGIIEGLGIPYNGPMAGKDIQGEFFNEKTDFKSPFYDGEQVKGMKALYHHGLDPDIKDAPIGDVIAAELRPEGKWVKMQLDKANKYYAAIKWLVQQGKLAFSSGAIPEGVQKAADGFISKWPWKEMSITPSPANPLAQIEGIKTAGEVTLSAVLEEIKKQEIKSMDTETKSVPASPAANNLPSVAMKPDPTVSAEANGHVAGENKTPPPVACKAVIKCTVCGKDTPYPEEIIKNLQALGTSVQSVLQQMGAGAAAPGPAGDQPGAPSMPGTNQGMAPENHETAPTPPAPGEKPPVESKPEGKPFEKKPEEQGEKEPEKPGEKEPDEDDKAIKCSKCGMPTSKCKCDKAVKTVDIMDNPAVKALVKELETVKERVKTLEALPITSGPAKSAIKTSDNPHMDNQDTVLDDLAREKFYDELANDTTVNYPTRQAASIKAGELAMRRTTGKGPQPLKQ